MNAFEAKLNGPLHGLLQWQAWDRLVDDLRGETAARWHVAMAGADAPAEPLSPHALALLLDEISALLRKDHQESYLGIVYVDDADSPSLIKIYDPNNLGSSCGSIGYKIEAGWVLSLDRPTPLASDVPLTGSRKRWWQALHHRLIPSAQ